jgi:mono/diheme cytochrome c family protein
MKKLLFTLPLLILCQCAVTDNEQGGISEVPNPSPEMVQKSGTSLDKLQRGHVVYMLHCAECHAYPLPQDLDEADFIDSVPKMVKHSGLATSAGSDVLAYILAVKKM